MLGALPGLITIVDKDSTSTKEITNRHCVLLRKAIACTLNLTLYETPVHCIHFRIDAVRAFIYGSFLLAVLVHGRLCSILDEALSEDFMSDTMVQSMRTDDRGLAKPPKIRPISSSRSINGKKRLSASYSKAPSSQDSYNATYFLYSRMTPCNDHHVRSFCPPAS